MPTLTPDLLEYHKAYREANRETINRKRAEYVAKYPERVKASSEADYKNNIEKIKIRRRAYAEKNRERLRLYQQNFRKSESGRLSAAKTKLKYTYGLTWPQFTRLYEDQKGMCAICQVPMQIGKGNKMGRINLNVDHCHTTGKVRGLLCQRCNTGIATFKDSKENMLRAVEYLKNPPFKGAE